ncbi:MAG: HD domain-containing protein [Oscillospiraceae bacterium]
MLTEKFLRDKFDNSEYFSDKPPEREYRYEHSIRVANIGKYIAEKEGLDAEAMAVACLLHDVSYCTTFKDREDYRNHGRYSAKIARPFLVELGLEQDVIDDICYGIAIHVDDKADFEGERTAFALTVGDADNIDRFDAYRIFENLKWIKYDEMSMEEKLEHTEKTIAKLRKYKELGFGTKTGHELWCEKLDFQIEFYQRLRHQAEISRL